MKANQRHRNPAGTRTTEIARKKSPVVVDAGLLFTTHVQARATEA